MISLNSINDFIKEINYELYEQTEADEILAEVRSIGDIIIIEFLGVRLWNSEDDERDEIYEDVYEELEPYIKNKINEIVKTVLNIHL